MDSNHVKKMKISRKQKPNKPTTIHNSAIMNYVNRRLKTKQIYKTNGKDDRTKTPILKNKNEKFRDKSNNKNPNNQIATSPNENYSKIEVNTLRYKNRNKNKVVNGAFAENTESKSYRNQSNRSTGHLYTIKQNKLNQTNNNNITYYNNSVHDPNEAGNIYKALKNLGKYKLDNGAATKSCTELEKEITIDTKQHIPNGHEKINITPNEKPKKKYSIVDYIFKEIKKEKNKKKNVNVDIKVTTYVVKHTKNNSSSMVNTGKKGGVHVVKIEHVPKHAGFVYQNQMK